MVERTRLNVTLYAHCLSGWRIQSICVTSVRTCKTTVLPSYTKTIRWMLCKDIYPAHYNYHTEHTKNLIRKSADFSVLKVPTIWLYENTLNASQLVLCLQRDGRWKEHNRRSGLLRRHLRCVNNYNTTLPTLLFIIYIIEHFWLLITLLVHWQCTSKLPTTDSNQWPTAFQISFQ